ncbi:MAG: CsgG/HfaB family protein [Elusimicrobia bacterium]|nr:CsgG/HfaB family protein [Elusimicrobiota bacterium]
MRIALPLAAALWCGCAARPIVAVKPGFDFARLGRVALLDFQNYDDRGGSGALVSRALEPYLLGAGYKLVERSQMQKLLQERALGQALGANAEAAESVGRLLGVEAMVMGGVTEFVSERSETYLQTTQNVSYDPVYRTVEGQDRQGRAVTRQEISHYDVVTTNEQIPVTYNVPAKIGFSARLVDVATGDVLWTGSVTAQGDNLTEAADSAAKRLVEALRKGASRS